MDLKDIKEITGFIKDGRLTGAQSTDNGIISFVKYAPDAAAGSADMIM